MATVGLNSILPLIPPVLTGQLAITTPVALSLPTCRIYNDTDATIGTVGWVPPVDGSPWAVVEPLKSTDKVIEPRRKWVITPIDIFLGIDHADTPASTQNYAAIAYAWIDAMTQVVPANYRLNPGALTLDPSIANIRWDWLGGDYKDNHPFWGTMWQGALLHTQLQFSILVSYQY